MVESNKLELHYYFSDNSHGFDAIVRNECEKELLQIYYEVASTLNLKLLVQSEPPKEGGFIEYWKFLGDNINQVTLIVSVIAVIISRKPVENKKLSQLQIENLELDNELKKEELRKLKINDKAANEIDNELFEQILEYVLLNYKVTWRLSNFYKKVTHYKRINKITYQRFLNEETVGTERKINRGDFHNYILHNDDLPNITLEDAAIDLISPVLKPGRFLWKGFFKKDIISFAMQDTSFQTLVQNGMTLNNKVLLITVLTQSRKIDENGHIKITGSWVKLVVEYAINGQRYLTREGEIYRSNNQFN